jgi:hypothetical protein
VNWDASHLAPALTKSGLTMYFDLHVPIPQPTLVYPQASTSSTQPHPGQPQAQGQGKKKKNKQQQNQNQPGGGQDGRGGPQIVYSATQIAALESRIDVLSHRMSFQFVPHISLSPFSQFILSRRIHSSLTSCYHSGLYNTRTDAIYNRSL